jgi:hypothetical protein
MKALTRAAPAPRDVVARLLDTPDPGAAVRSLEPVALVRLVRTCGLEECGPIVALATPEQLLRVFDVDLWRQDEAGAEERLDADRFALWLEVLAEAGAEVAASKLAAMDLDFVTAALSRHVLVLDPISVLTTAPEAELADDDASDELRARRDAMFGLLESAVSVDLAGYQLVARRGEHWDALLSILLALDQDHSAFLARVMRRCAHLASEWIVDNGGLYDVLSADAQLLDDVAGERERRRDEEGYVAPAEAIAFLRLAREREMGGPAAGHDPITARYFRELERRNAGVPAPEWAVAGAPSPLDRLLSDRGEGGHERLRHVRRVLISARGDAALARRQTQQLAYLANVLVAGCSSAGRSFRAVEAAQAVLALCNLGLETGEGAFAAEGLVGAFRSGWSTTHRHVVTFVAESLVSTLARLRCPDPELRRDLRALGKRVQAELARGAPWRAGEYLDALAALDQPSWTILTGLLEECPLVPTGDPSGTRATHAPSEREFLSETRQIAWVRKFMDSLPEQLSEGKQRLSGTRGYRKRAR